MGHAILIGFNPCLLTRCKAAAQWTLQSM